MRFTDVLGELGLRQPDSTAIDTGRPLAVVAVAAGNRAGLFPAVMPTAGHLCHLGAGFAAADAVAA